MTDCFKTVVLEQELQKSLSEARLVSPHAGVGSLHAVDHFCAHDKISSLVSPRVIDSIGHQRDSD